MRNDAFGDVKFILRVDDLCVQFVFWNEKKQEEKKKKKKKGMDWCCRRKKG